MIGRDGIVGTFAALDGRVALNRAIVQIAGQALRCQVEKFKALVQNHSVIRSIVAAHEQALFAQAQQSAACNVAHVIESRLARWLLRAADLTGTDELHLTQEYIAQILGVRRTSVTVVARTLQQAGMIQYRRGLIKLADVPALRQVACECYRTVKRNSEAFLHSEK
jgi:CRP-like cAMP-binding protein